MDRYVRSLWAAVVGSWFIPPLAGRTGVRSRWFFHVGARRRSRRGNLGQTATQPGRFFGKPQNDTNGVILATVGSGFSIGSRMTRTRTYSTSGSHPHVILSHSEGSSTKRQTRPGSLFTPFRMTTPSVIVSEARQSRQTASYPGRFFGKPQNDTNGEVILSAREGSSTRRWSQPGSFFTVFRMTRIRTWTLETGRWTLTLLPSPSIRKMVVIGLAALLVATTLVPILNFIQPNQVQAAWYNEDWKFRKAVTIDHSADESNVYTSISMDTSDTSRFKADCSDLRFTDYNGTTIPYHIASGCGTSTTEIQLLFGTLTAGEQTIYVYYGNESASDTRVLEAFNNEATGVTLTLGSEESSAGPIAAWKFDEGYGTVAHDSANTHNGTINGGATWQSEEMCPSGKCLRFDGVDDYVDLGAKSEFDGRSVMTVSAWLKPISQTQGYWIGQGGVGGGWAISWNSTGTIAFLSKQADNNNAVFAYTLSTIPASLWTHVSVILTVDTVDLSNNTVEIYVNGAKQNVYLDRSALPVLPTTKFRIGSRGTTATPLTFFNGMIDDVKIYNYARTQQQIQQDYVTGMQSLNQQQANLSNGLVGYWKMDESSWNGTSGEVKDASGNGNNGQTINGTAVGIGKFGNGGRFDGVDDYISLGTPTTSQSRTYAIWANSSIYPELNRRGMLGENGNTRIDYGNGNSSSFHALVSLSSGTPSYLELTTTVTELNSWNYLVLIVDNEKSAASFYLNGELSSTATWDPAVRHANNGGGAYIGRVNGSAQFDGGMDEARIYNRALTSSEVQQLYTYAPKPVAYYDFEEGSGNSVYDKSGNGHTGTWSGTSDRYVAGQVGKAGSFNGVDGVIDVADMSFAAKDISIGWWQRTPMQPGSFYRIFQSNGNAAIYFNGDAHNGLYGYLGESTPKVFLPGKHLDDDQWHYIALVATASDGRIKAYLDGTLTSDLDAAFAGISVDSLMLAGDDTTSLYRLKGLLDEFKIYNYARTPGQVVQDMQAGQSAVDSPVGYWKFDEGKGVVARNSGVAGSGLDGTVKNVASPAVADSGWSVDGKTRGGIRFDGVDDFVESENSAMADIRGPVTLSAWIKPATLLGYHTIAGKSGGSVSSAQYELQQQGSSIAFVVTNGSANFIATYPQPLEVNKWQHVLGVFDGSGVLVYVDGKLGARVPFTGTKSATSTTFRIGSRTTGTPLYFQGSIDEVKLYNAALTPQAILVDYNQSAGSIIGSTSTESTTTGTGQTATKPSNSAGSKYCVPGDTSDCAAPVVAYDFEEGSGATVADVSGNNHEGSWHGSGAQYGPGRTGKAGYFDGDDYTTTSSEADLNPTSITVEAWVQLEVIDSHFYTFVGKWRPGVSQQYLLQIDTDNHFAFWTGDGGGGGSRIASSTVPVTGRWYHVVGTQTGSTKQLYINGILESRSTGGTPLGSSTIPFTVGSKQDGTGSYFEHLHGQLDEIRVYDYARTPAQVAWDYNYGKPIAHYKFDECSGTAIHDSSGNGLDGVLSLGSGGTTAVGNCENAASAWGMAKSGKYNSAMSFDGVDDYVDVTNTVLPTSNMTISMWIKPSSVDAHYRALYAWGPTSGCTPASQYLVLYNSQLWLRTGCGSQVMSKQVIQTDQWQHVLITIDPEGVTSIYRNGVLINFSAPSSSRMGQTVGPGVNTIGMYYAGGVATGFYEGLLDDVQIFNYMLTDAQIKTLYNGGAVRWGE